MGSLPRLYINKIDLMTNPRLLIVSPFIVSENINLFSTYLCQFRTEVLNRLIRTLSMNRRESYTKTHLTPTTIMEENRRRRK